MYWNQSSEKIKQNTSFLLFFIIFFSGVQYMKVNPVTASFRKQASVPGDWKLANLTPISNKDDRKMFCNYKPISLTSVAGKIKTVITVNRS